MPLPPERIYAIDDIYALPDDERILFYFFTPPLHYQITSLLPRAYIIRYLMRKSLSNLKRTLLNVPALSLL